MACWRRRCTEDVGDVSLGLPRSGVASAGAARRGRSDEGHDVDQGRLQPRGVACAARFAGELPVLLATLHKTKRITVRMMRLDRGKQMEDTGGTERLERAGMESKTAAV